MINDDADAIAASPEPHGSVDGTAGARRSLRRGAVAWIGRHGRTARVAALIAVAAVIGAAYAVGGPPTGGGQAAAALGGISADRVTVQGAGGDQVSKGAPGAVTAAAATAGAAPAAANNGPQADDQTSAAAESSQIIKTGELSLEVSDIDRAVGQAQAAVAGLGGSVDSSNQSGTGDEATASIVFRVPAARWDEALATLRKIGSKVLLLQTSAVDVTAQAVDLDARIANLEATEAALQAIMARATAIADVIAVENQLSQTQGQIEQLKAERDHLKNQAAMSTLTVDFQLPGKTVTTMAAQGWTLGQQIDEAGAALVRIGQGLATIVVWVFVVVLPLAIAGLALLGIAALGRRVLGRGRRRNSVAGA